MVLCRLRSTNSNEPFFLWSEPPSPPFAIGDPSGVTPHLLNTYSCAFLSLEECKGEQYHASLDGRDHGARQAPNR
jgi:hypothetical protein